MGSQSQLASFQFYPSRNFYVDLICPPYVSGILEEPPQYWSIWVLHGQHCVRHFRCVNRTCITSLRSKSGPLHIEDTQVWEDWSICPQAHRNQVSSSIWIWTQPWPFQPIPSLSWNVGSCTQGSSFKCICPGPALDILNIFFRSKVDSTCWRSSLVILRHTGIYMVASESKNTELQSDSNSSWKGFLF